MPHRSFSPSLLPVSFVLSALVLLSTPLGPPRTAASTLVPVEPVPSAPTLAAAGPVGAVAARTADESPWQPPLGAPLRVSAPYSLPNGPYRAGHRGIDLPAGAGADVLAPVSGSVSFSGTVVDRPVLSIRVDARTVISLEPVSSELRAGEAVVRGALVGTVAQGGHCDGACLHLGVRVDGAYANPMRFFRTRPILLPW